jgi:hypothetical protein
MHKSLATFAVLLGALAGFAVFGYAVHASNAPTVRTAPTFAPSDVKGDAFDVPPTSVTLPETINASPVVIAISPHAPKARDEHRVWTCGAPHALTNDAVQTVRECQYR